MTSAIIYIPAALHIATGATLQVATYADQCLAYCASRGYAVVGVVATDWAAVLHALRLCTVQVVVVARDEHLDPNRTPRIEIAEHAHLYGGNARPASLRDRRTQAIRRNAAR